MERRNTKRIILCILTALAGIPATGCSWRDLEAAGFTPGSFLGGAVVGYLLGQGTVRVEVQRECYENGQPIDCADLPFDPQ